MQQAEQVPFVACEHANNVAVGELNSEVDGKILLYLLDLYRSELRCLTLQGRPTTLPGDYIHTFRKAYPNVKVRSILVYSPPLPTPILLGWHPKVNENADNDRCGSVIGASAHSLAHKWKKGSFLHPLETVTVCW